GSFHNPTLGMDIVAGSLERIEMIEAAMDVGGVDGAVTWTKSGDAIEGAMIKNAAGDTMATTDAEGKYFFWARAQSLAYNIFDVDGNLIGTSMIEATAQQNVTKDIALEKQTVDDGEDTEGMTTIAWVLLGVVIVLILLLVVMAMKGGSEE
ncbi:MAG: hypothetical protein KAS77_11320, partial [Thermoplasmata archaeon]|nr:hypothetical protein [Thermoplasmata archaeon]